MARVLYGVCGERSGHCTRSKIVLEHLVEKGHEVRVLTDGNGASHFQGIFPHDEVVGWSGSYHTQSLDTNRTFRQNVANSVLRAPSSFRKIKQVMREFNPDITITDFQPWVALVSRLIGVPLISIDHQHLISNCELEYPRSIHKHFLPARVAVNNNLAQHYFITSFFFPEIRSGKRFVLFGQDYGEITTLVGPLLRKDALARGSSEGEHILVYVSHPQGEKRVSELMKSSQCSFRCYGLEKVGADSNVEFKGRDNLGFLDDLASCRAVVTNGGYNVISEALFFGKPIYAIPFENQFEQEINGYYLEVLGYGAYDRGSSLNNFQIFLEGLDYHRRNIARDKDKLNGNEKLFAELDRKIEQVAKA